VSRVNWGKIYKEEFYMSFCGIMRFEKQEKLSRCSYGILRAWPPAPAAPAQEPQSCWSPTVAGFRGARDFRPMAGG